MTRRFELSDGSPNRFWELTVGGVLLKDRGFSWG